MSEPTLDTPLVPVAEAKRIGKKYEKDQVIIIGLDRSRARSTMTTWGVDKAHCTEIANVGEWIMAHLEKMFAGKGEAIGRTETAKLRAELDRLKSEGPTPEEYAEAVAELSRAYRVLQEIALNAADGLCC